MEWEHLFEDLEGQLAAEWEAERAALDAESERLRIAKLTLRERLQSIGSDGSRLHLDLIDGQRWEASLKVIGADWIGVAARDDPRLRILPLWALSSLGVDHGALLGSLGERAGQEGLRERMTFGFVLRDLARRRVPVTVSRRGVDPQQGTIDRAGVDHLDLALHDAGEARRARTVRGFRMIPFDAVCWVRVESGGTGVV